MLEEEEIRLAKAEKMFRRYAQADDVTPLDDVRFTGPSVPSRSCCCPARPAVKVIMPPTATRRHSVDLWLCRHHYRESTGTLITARARVEDLSELTDSPQADHAAAPGIRA